MDRSQNTVKKHLNDRKTHAAIISELLMELNHANNASCQVELAEAEIELKEHIIVGYLILQCAELLKLEPYYNFFSKFCDVNKFEDLEKHTDYLYLALVERELADCNQPEMWERLRPQE